MRQKRVREDANLALKKVLRAEGWKKGKNVDSRPKFLLSPTFFRQLFSLSQMHSHLWFKLLNSKVATERRYICVLCALNARCKAGSNICLLGYASKLDFGSLWVNFFFFLFSSFSLSSPFQQKFLRTQTRNTFRSLFIDILCSPFSALIANLRSSRQLLLVKWMEINYILKSNKKSTEP